VIYQDPLAYLLGLEGIGLLRAFSGEFDRDFVAARLAGRLSRMLADRGHRVIGVDSSPEMLARAPV
jgi:hypothetical protein